MPRKIDSRLQEAVQQGYAKKIKKQQKESDEKRAAKEKHERELRRYLPKARTWIRDKMFKLIAEAEATGSTRLTLNENTDGIPTEVIYGLVKKINGLDITCNQEVIWEDSDYGKEYGLVYTITWRSADPNLNRDY